MISEIQKIPDLESIKKTHHRIKPYIHKTPVLHNRALNEMTDSRIFLKCENFQKVGAFKIRGATNAVLLLNEAESGTGVVTHSSGNHAAALAYAAGIKNIPAYIVMPGNAPQVKINAVKNYRGIITFCEPTLEARESTADRIIEETGAIFVHPYNDYRIIAGQATAARELLLEIPDLDIILAPVGGGGLMSGTALSAKYMKPGIKVYGCEPENADDAYRSFKSHTLIPSQNPVTIADGLKTSLGSKTFQLISNYVDDILLLSETEIIEAMRFILERMKIIIEPSSAVVIAAVMFNKINVSNKKVGVIISGGNVDFEIYFAALKKQAVK